MTLKQFLPASVLWQETAARKRQCNLAKIPQRWKLSPEVIEKANQRRSIADGFIDDLLDSETRRITNLDVPALMEVTGNGSLSANHNLLQIGFDRAIERAKFLDEYWEAHQKPIGPLHGLPITMKDQFHVKGMNTTMAYVGWIDTSIGRKNSPCNMAAESQIVKELEALGAITIAKLSSGGSSGGEGAVQALRGSAIGIGSGNGGFVAIPAAFNEVYSIKPSPDRLSFLNVAHPSPGQNNIPTVPGILGPSVASLKYLLGSLVLSQAWLQDPDVVPIPWKDNVGLEKRLSFGIMKFDGTIMPHPPVQRGLDMVVRALCAAGHDLIEWQPPAYSRALFIQNVLMNANGGYDIFENLALSGEPLIPELEEDYPNDEPDSPLSAILVEKQVQQLIKYKLEYHHYWKSTANVTCTGRPVDAIILPVWSSAAIVPGKPSYGGDYIGASNVVDHTTLVILVTHADMHIDKIDDRYCPISDDDRDNWKSYDPAVYDGTPVGIQIECQRFEEEKLLDIGQIVVEALTDLKNKTNSEGGAIDEDPYSAYDYNYEAQLLFSPRYRASLPSSDIQLPQASEPEAPIEGYGVVVPEWEVKITPSGPKTVLSGTVEEVHEELLQLNPDYYEEFITNSTASELSERDSGFDLVRRTDFSDAEYHCGGRWKKCKTWAVDDGIYYLRRVKGKPKNGPEPGNCGRNAKSKELNSFGSIADGAAFIRKKCYIPDRGPPFPGQVNRLSGQAFHHTRWSVIVRENKSYLLTGVLGVDAPIEGYGVVVPEWEVEVTPGTSTVLKGTIEETDTSKRDTDAHLFRRTDFRAAEYFCRGRWPQCTYGYIVDGIEYLRHVQGKPKNDPGPGNCGRNASSKTLNGFGSIADGAEYILHKCSSQGWSNGVSGRVFHKTKWDVIVRKDKC
ncbi:general amidase [Fusarium austroafricanum]|uniref:General amidase n=1 Tax=Fusarium austroafricanum TaxID=2364996 RepID=A0A8H4NWJ3_9HYPO|nr:general amidase [Fusarium austroafricanum]